MLCTECVYVNKWIVYSKDASKNLLYIEKHWFGAGVLKETVGDKHFQTKLNYKL